MLKAALRKIVSNLPPELLRALGRLQFHHPLLRRTALVLGTQMTSGDGVIRHGLGAGLRFDPAGGYPGYLLGTSEPAEQELLARYLKPGGVFYDIGANVGFFSTIAARMVLPGGSVWAFEPFPASAAQARRNAALNRFAHVEVIQVAVGRRPGRVRLALGAGSAEHRLANNGEGPEVEVVTIDDWRELSSAPPPDLVMVDVEGAELDALAGMIGVLRLHRPVVACEVHWLGQAFTDFVESELVPMGYSVRALAGEIPTGPERWHALLVPTTVSDASPPVES